MLQLVSQNAAAGKLHPEMLAAEDTLCRFDALHGELLPLWQMLELVQGQQELLDNCQGLVLEHCKAEHLPEWQMLALEHCLDE